MSSVLTASSCVLINVCGRYSNVPADSNTLLLFCSNSVTAALVKTIFNQFFVPRAAAKLTRIKYGIPWNARVDPVLVVNTFRTQVGICLLVEVVTVLVAPVATMLLLDVSFRAALIVLIELLSL